MAYRDDISALSPDHHWDFDGNSTAIIGGANGTDTSIIYTSANICEDATNCAETNAIANDRISLPTTTTINNSAQTIKCVAGWVVATTLEPHPCRIYGEGTNTTAFQFAMAYGNNCVFEVVEPTNFNIQIFADVPLSPNRSYHLCGIFEGSGGGNIVRFYLDGVEQLNATPTNRVPGTANLDVRGVGEFGDPVSTVGLGAGVVLLQAATNMKYNHWAMWDGAGGDLTTLQVREELFEKGALPTTTIAAGTQAAMQTTLDGLASTVRADSPLCIRVSTVTGDGALNLDADNITFNPLASIHVQYMGTGTLTWTNSNGGDAGIGSTPNGGTIVFVTPVTVSITALDSTTFQPVSGAQVLVEADTGGDLAAGTTILSGVTNGSGILTTSTFGFTNDQPVRGRVRKGSLAPFYETGIISGTITNAGLALTVLIVPDSVAK